MKTKTIISILILICVVKSQSQNYQSLNSGRISFFSKQNNNMKCVKFDSVVYKTDSVFYPFPNFRKLGYECYTPYGFSWIGRKIIIQKDGMNVFFNKNNDSIKIKTNAKLNESWNAYKITDSTTVVAKVISIDTLNFLNLIDSVKTINFQAYNKSMEPIDYELNNLSLILSKNYGLIKTLNFSLFPNLVDDNFDDNHLLNYDLIGLSNPKVGVQNLTWLDVYDFQVGDELHILYESSDLFIDINGRRSYATTKKTKLKYLERSDFKDSVVYRIEREESTFEQLEKKDSTRLVYKLDTIQVSYKSKSSFDKLPDEPIVSVYASANYASANTMYNGKNVSKTIPDMSYYGNISCMKLPISDGCFPDYTYLKGLGGPYYNCTSEAFSLSSVDNSLAYYKKGNMTGGTPLIITDVRNIVSENDIHLYPNPATDVVFVQVGIQNTPCLFELFDINGKLILKNEIRTNENSIPINSLGNGVYIYRVVQNSTTIKTGKLIKIKLAGNI